MSSAWRCAHVAWLASRAAFSWRQTCHLPGKKTELPPSSSSTDVATDSRNQRSWATRMTAASIVGELLLEPLHRGHVEVVGRLVEEQQIGAAGERSCERGARQLSAGEGLEPAVEVGVSEAEAAQHGSGVVAPAVAARVLEPRLRLAVAPERLRAVIAGGHRLLEAAQLALGLDQVGRAREGVFAQREAAEPAAGAGRGARRGRPSPRRARRLRARSRPSGHAAASSCRRRSGRRARAGRRRSSLNETPSKRASPENSLRRRMR